MRYTHVCIYIIRMYMIFPYICFIYALISFLPYDCSIRFLFSLIAGDRRVGGFSSPEVPWVVITTICGAIGGGGVVGLMILFSVLD